MLTIVGGIYREICLRPQWDEVYGSAGRAASAIARLGGKVELRGYLDADLAPVVDLFQRARNAPDAATRLLASFGVLSAALTHPAMRRSGGTTLTCGED